MEAQQDLEQLLQRFELPLLQYATRITGNNERARDVVQEAFIKFQRNGAVAPEKQRPGCLPFVATARSTFAAKKGD